MTEESGLPDGARTRNTLEYGGGREGGREGGKGRDNILTYSETLQQRVCDCDSEVEGREGVALEDFRTDDISACSAVGKKGGGAELDASASLDLKESGLKYSERRYLLVSNDKQLQLCSQLCKIVINKVF